MFLNFVTAKTVDPSAGLREARRLELDKRGPFIARLKGSDIEPGKSGRLCAEPGWWLMYRAGGKP